MTAKTATAAAPVLSRQRKAGVTISIARVHKQMRKSAVADQISSKAPLYVAAAIEKVLSTILEQATENVRNGQRTQKGELKTKRVINGDIIAAVRSNPDLARLFSGFAFSSHAPANKPIRFILSAPQQEKRKKDKEKREAEREAAKKRLGA
tara:strand:- start:180 stop:632 length:453 start_codon:yes stop_codon:yes gene_type:complete